MTVIKNIKKYNSYKGTCGKIASNRLRRRFSTDRHYQKIVTNVTELRWGNKAPDERAYFTAFMDLYNKEIISWEIGLHPNVDFVMSPLNELM